MRCETGLMAAVAPPAPPPPWPELAHCIYTSCYCEENVYWLARSLLQMALAPSARLAVVFISNKSKMVPIWCQKAGAGAAVVWDYHVLLVAQQRCGAAYQSALVFDLDSTLPFPCLLSKYRSQALLGGCDLPPHYKRWYRVVAAQQYVDHFASDRSHMKSRAGGWLKPPPPYPCISAAAHGCNSTFPAYLDFGSQQQLQQGPSWEQLAEQRYGIVLEEDDFFSFFGCNS